MNIIEQAYWQVMGLPPLAETKEPATTQVDTRDDLTNIDVGKRDSSVPALAAAPIDPDSELYRKLAQCRWSQDDEGSYDTDCGEKFTFIDDGPDGMKFCCYCGKPLIDVPWVEEAEPDWTDDDAYNDPRTGQAKDINREQT